MRGTPKGYLVCETPLVSLPNFGVEPELLACTNSPDAWFEQGSYQYAKQLCATCPITKRCLEYALDNDERHGVWGMTTPGERMKLKTGRAA